MQNSVNESIKEYSFITKQPHKLSILLSRREEASAIMCYLPAAAFRSFLISLVLQLCLPWMETKAGQDSGGGSSLAIWLEQQGENVLITHSLQHRRPKLTVDQSVAWLVYSQFSPEITTAMYNVQHNTSFHQKKRPLLTPKSNFKIREIHQPVHRGH